MISRSTDVRSALRSKQRGFLLNPARFGGGGGGGGTDPNFANVTSLIHFNGTDGSTTFTDQKGLTWAPNGNAQIDTAQSKFGGASGLFDGTDDWISNPANSSFDMGSGNFCYEFWVRFNSVGTRQIIMGQSNFLGQNTSISVLIEKTATDKMRALSCSGAASIGEVVGGTSVSTGVWYHFAYTRNGDDFRLFLDGVLDATLVTGSGALNASGSDFSIGRVGELAALYFNGWIDDFRITKGVARYTANFTPPTAQFPDS